MDIAVIIPSHNRQHMLDRSLDSVQRQHRAAAEVIVVDDGSTDQTRVFLKSYYPEVRYIGLQNNRGVSHARNIGINVTDCEWLAFLDSDDEWLPEKLERQSELLAANPDYRICHTDEIWIRNGRRVNPMQKHAKQGGYIFQRCLPRCVISPSSVLMHRRVFETIGLFDEGLPACEDYDMWLRVCSNYPVLFSSDKLILKYGGHADQLSRRHWGMDRFRIQALEKMLQSQSLTMPNRALVLQTLLEKIAILLKGAEKRSNTELQKICLEKLSKCQDLFSRSQIEMRMYSGEMAQ